jgi:hypothetical protein
MYLSNIGREFDRYSDCQIFVRNMGKFEGILRENLTM